MEADLIIYGLYLVRQHCDIIIVFGCITLSRPTSLTQPKCGSVRQRPTLQEVLQQLTDQT